MIESLKIGEYIFDRIKTITGYDCYPCIADNDVKFPYIVYNRTGLSTRLTKDGYTEDNISFEISVYSDKYAQSIAVADAVRGALEVMSATHNDVLELDNSVIVNSNEMWQNNTYVQNITWNANVTRYIDMSLSSNVGSITFVDNARYSYVSHTAPEAYEVDLGSTINTGYKYVTYKETSIDPYIVPITITQNNIDVTDECTFSFPTDKNISMVYENGNLTFTAKNIIGTQFDSNVVVTKGDESISIPFSVNFTISTHKEIPEYDTSDIFDVTRKQPLTLYGKTAGKGDILANGIWHGPSFTIEQDAPWPLNFGTLTVNVPKPEPIYGQYFNLSNASASRNEAIWTVSLGDEHDTTLVQSSNYSSGCFYVSEQLATDDTFTTFEKSFQSGLYNAIPSAHDYMCTTVASPVSTFFEAYDLSNVDHVDMVVQICSDNKSVSSVKINGVDITSAIEAQYGADWVNTVPWTSHTFKCHSGGGNYSTHTFAMCCRLELTGLPVTVLTNMTANGNNTGYTTSDGYFSQLMYNFKFVEKQ